MATDREADALCTLWQSDGAAGFRLTPERLQRLAEKLQRNTRYASLATYGLCLVGIGGFAWFALTFHNPLRRVGALLTAIGIAYSLLQVRRYFLDMRSLAHGMSAQPSVLYYRAILLRVRDFSRGSEFWWRFGAMVPGPLLFTAAYAIAHPRRGLAAWQDFAIALALLAIAIPLNVGLAGRRLRKKIDELDRFTRDD